MQRHFSHTCDGTDVQADRRSSTCGRAPNAIDTLQGSLKWLWTEVCMQVPLVPSKDQRCDAFLKMTLNCSVHARTLGPVPSKNQRRDAYICILASNKNATPTYKCLSEGNIECIFSEFFMWFHQYKRQSRYWFYELIVKCPNVNTHAHTKPEVI